MYKLLAGDKKLQELYTVAVINRFQLLQEEADSASDQYDKFIEAKKAMEKVIPLERKTRRARFSSDPRVTEAKETRI